jgi:hypothetical protein
MKVTLARATGRRLGKYGAKWAHILVLGSMGCSAADGGEDVATVTQAVYDFDEEAGVFQPAAVDPRLRSNIVVSLWKPGKWSVAGATNTGDGCSGTLVTPSAVLTAASCARRLNTNVFDVLVGPRTADVATSGETIKIESNGIVSFGVAANEPSFSGKDVAIVFLKTPVLEKAVVHRPPFTKPAPLLQVDADGSAPYALGVSGWSPFTTVPGLAATDASTVRQTFFKDSVGGSDEFRLTWLSQRPLWAATVFRPITGMPKIGLAPGDNGGPLFAKGANDRWDVIGVASLIGAPPDDRLAPIYDWAALPSRQEELCRTPAGAPTPPETAPYQCVFWVDVTSASVKNWVTETLLDRSRGSTWLASHPRMGEGQSGAPWIGELDYTGPCNLTADPDCDHTYTKNADGSKRDNCPTVANVDQKDTLDTGTGDACCPVGGCGEVVTFAGTGTPGATDAPLATNGTFNDPAGLAATASGVVFVADWGNNSIRSIGTTKSLSTFMTGSPNLLANPRAEVAGAAIPQWRQVEGIWSIGTRSNCTSPCAFTPFDGSAWFNGVRGAVLARLEQIIDLNFAAPTIATGAIRGAFSSNIHVRAGAARVTVEYFDGAGVLRGSFDSGNISAANTPTWTVVDDERWLPASTRGARVSLHLVSGETAFDGLQFRLISTLGGTDRRMSGPTAVAQASNGDIYAGANGIWRSSGGTVTKIADAGGYVAPKRVSSISAVSDGWLYFANPTSSTVHVRASNGAGYYASLQSSVSRTTALAAVPFGNGHRLWVASAASARINYYDCPKSSQVAVTVQCTLQGSIGSSAGFVDDVDGTQGGERFGYMNALLFGPHQELLIAEESNHAVRRYLSPFTTTVAGNGLRGFVNGPSLAARFSSPSGLAVLPSGDVLVADRNNKRVRMIIGGAR